MKITRKKLRRLLKETVSDAFIVSEIQSFVDNNQYLKGTVVNEQDLIHDTRYVLFAPESSLGHIKDRHMNVDAPGSTMYPEVDLRQTISAVLQTPETSSPEDFMVKWEGIVSPVGPIGDMGVASAPIETVMMMQDYQMPGGRNEMVKVAQGQRIPTDEITLVTAKLGQLTDGRLAISLVTMYPGGSTVDGIPIPFDRNQFAASGLYFPLPATSPILADI